MECQPLAAQDGATIWQRLKWPSVARQAGAGRRHWRPWRHAAWCGRSRRSMYVRHWGHTPYGARRGVLFLPKLVYSVRSTRWCCGGRQQGKHGRGVSSRSLLDERDNVLTVWGIAGGDKTVIRPSYLHPGIPHTGNTASWYCNIPRSLPLMAMMQSENPSCYGIAPLHSLT